MTGRTSCCSHITPWTTWLHSGWYVNALLDPLTDATLRDAVADLTGRDPRLARIAAEYGPPPLWERDPGFPTLLRTILEQQVSLASARAAYEKLLVIASPLTPERFLGLNDSELKSSGFSRQKTRYGRDLAAAIVSGRLDLEGLQALDDQEARAALTRVKGIGKWTADIYLLLALRRPDVWPAGDLALATAVRQAMGLAATPDPVRMEAIGAAWQPWRSVAARLLWHYYLSTRSTKKGRSTSAAGPGA
jgi:DNA-3-methyladenine glycosylase II